MNRISLFAVSAGLVALAFIGLTLALTIGLALAAGGLVALGAAKAIRALGCFPGTDRSDRGHGPIQRIWNDGKGTIIDM